MSIELKEETFVHTIWFVEGTGWNWMAVLGKEPDDAWKVQYRFRYYEDDKVMDSNDRRSFYVIDGQKGTDQVRDELHAAVTVIYGMTCVRAKGESGGEEVTSDAIEVKRKGALEVIEYMNSLKLGWWHVDTGRMEHQA